RSSTAGVFPLRLGWQTVRRTPLFAQLPQELLTVMPGNLIHGTLLALYPARIVTHDRLPASLGHRINRQVKPPGQRDFVLPFIVQAPPFTFRSAHQEGARWNPGKLHPD